MAANVDVSDYLNPTQKQAAERQDADVEAFARCIREVFTQNPGELPTCGDSWLPRGKEVHKIVGQMGKMARKLLNDEDSVDERMRKAALVKEKYMEDLMDAMRFERFRPPTPSRRKIKQFVNQYIADANVQTATLRTFKGALATKFGPLHEKLLKRAMKLLDAALQKKVADQEDKDVSMEGDTHGPSEATGGEVAASSSSSRPNTAQAAAAKEQADEMREEEEDEAQRRKQAKESKGQRKAEKLAAAEKAQEQQLGTADMKKPGEAGKVTAAAKTEEELAAAADTEIAVEQQREGAEHAAEGKPLKARPTAQLGAADSAATFEAQQAEQAAEDKRRRKAENAARKAAAANAQEQQLHAADSAATSEVEQAAQAAEVKRRKKAAKLAAADEKQGSDFH
eukprot:gnl/TRDRNA2_/TRDRNA2_175015_c7_seq11.p1 gnl/TRDRNA2_/TRDRNA2_175015_c7~~gnl/TRDRNA2_/TRDRNA2_175015_c7_seq11.p1  ORF type:complete len:397 (-),score=131.24 gnl/TRDRNA2_/TRDRNA2_175015_c7_seq11:295-1485(-)